MNHKDIPKMTLEEFNETSFGYPQTMNGDYILLAAYPSLGDLIFVSVIYSGEKEAVEALRDRIIELESFDRKHRETDWRFPLKNCPKCYAIYEELKQKVPITLNRDGSLFGFAGLQIRNIEELFSPGKWCFVNTAELVFEGGQYVWKKAEVAR